MYKSILITGGSSGLGFELARFFLPNASRLILVSKPIAELEKAKAFLQKDQTHCEIIIRKQDLSVSNAAKDLFEWYKQQDWSIDILINNAGFGLFGPFFEIDLDKDLEMLRLNMICTYELSRLFGEEMIRKNSGIIVAVASQAAYTPSPYLASYAATKAFLLHFYKAANYELKQQKSAVKLIAVCPPAMRTGFAQKANMENHKIFSTWLTVPVELVAKRIVVAIKKGKQGFIPSWKIRWTTHLLDRLLPNKWKIPITGYFLKK